MFNIKHGYEIDEKVKQNTKHYSKQVKQTGVSYVKINGNVSYVDIVLVPVISVRNNKMEGGRLL